MHLHYCAGQERDGGVGLAGLDHPHQRGGAGDAQGQDAQVPRSVAALPTLSHLFLYSRYIFM